MQSASTRRIGLWALMPRAETVTVKEGVYTLEASIEVTLGGFSAESAASLVEVIRDQALTQGLSIEVKDGQAADLTINLDAAAWPLSTYRWRRVSRDFRRRLR
ncbi:MAG: hypothetical protein O2869_04585 [Bacteroidetes bacterium]|nr:hypothetical protein [Bacteroidota bacterium]MDA0950882.1 hypothetical protein [Bacteroidota bacterium]